MEKDPQQLESESKKDEIIRKFQAFFGFDEPTLSVWKKGILGAGVLKGGFVSYPTGYDRPTLQEDVEVKRGIGGREISKKHTFSLTINSGEDSEGRNAALHTYFRIDVITKTLLVTQVKGSSFRVNDSYALYGVDKLSELEQLQVLESLIPDTETTRR
jgi:hypothetical protein